MRTELRNPVGHVKVYGGNLGGRWRAIMAASSMAEFTRATRITRDHAAETGNLEEITQAMSSPGTLFTKPYQLQEPQVWTPKLRLDRTSDED
jgi:hypothetical protein